MTIPKEGPKFDMRINPVYQVDWMNQAAGKHMAATKRRIRFRFGFSDAAALQAGETGSACRGEEHEVLLVWSLLSGKKVVSMDDRVVHISCEGKITQSRFETSFPLGYHTLKIIAHAVPPSRNVDSGWRQFDLLLDGLSFFAFAKLYSLGSKKGKQSSYLSVPRIVVNDNDSNSSSNPPSSACAYSHSPTMEDNRASKCTTDVVALPAHPVARMMSSKPLSQLDLLDLGPSEPYLTPTNDEFAPRIAAPELASFAMMSNQILSAYAPIPAPAFVAPPSQNSATSYSHTHQTPTEQSYGCQPRSRQQQHSYIGQSPSRQEQNLYQQSYQHQ